MADCETWSLRPQAVNDPVSAIACRISSCRRSIRFPEAHPVRLGSEERDDGDTKHHGESDPGHGGAVAEVLAKNRLERRNARRQRRTKLIGKPREKPAITRRGQFV